ncbi:hypothetical protein ACFL5Z_16735 [Planctomycetota bacterium]
MKDGDIDTLLRQHLSGDQPREALKQETLCDSMAKFARIRRRRSTWRRVELVAAAVLIAGVAFLGGRLSAPPTMPGNVDVTLQAAAESGTIAVPSDLVAWLDAARLFRRLGMEDRMARAVEHAGKLLPYEAVAKNSITGQALAVDDEAVESISGIIAQSFGGHYYESKMD